MESPSAPQEVNPQTQIPQSLYPQQKHKTHWPALILVSLIALSLFGLAIFFAAQKPTPEPEVIKTTPLPSEVSTKEDDPITNWETYTNTKYGYSVAYPTDSFTLCQISGKEDEFFLFEKGECFAGARPTELYIKEYSAKHAFYQTSNLENCYSVLKENIIFAKVRATKYSNIIKKATDECYKQEVLYAANQVHIVLEDDKSQLEIYVNEKNNSNIKNQILSTFQFANQTSYTCPAGEYIDCMPSLGPGGVRLDQCDETYITWAKANCPGFKGAAY